MHFQFVLTNSAIELVFNPQHSFNGNLCLQKVLLRSAESLFICQFHTLHVHKYSTFKFHNAFSLCVVHTFYHTQIHSAEFHRFPIKSIQKIQEKSTDSVLTCFLGSQRYALNSLVSVWSSLWV